MSRIISFLLIFMALAANARQISPEEAQSIASEFFNSGSLSNGKKAPRRAVRASRSTECDTENQPYYIFNTEDGAGFVIISGDTRAKKIIGYSDKGICDIDNMPPQLSTMFEQYAKVIAQLSTEANQDSSWSTPQIKSEDNGVLLETVNWGQTYPYNLTTPKSNGINTPTGCVATAAAIIMKYHNWPECGTRSHTTFYKGSMKEFDFTSISFDWKLMDILWENGEVNNSSAQEVSKLMRALGQALDMDYSLDGSGSNDAHLGRLMYEYFKYSVDGQTIYSKNFPEDKWNQIMHNEIDCGRPFIYGGNEDNVSAGHEFVCDGYNDDMYHINWGWDGQFNGFYSLKALLGYNFNQSMVINLEPRRDDNEGFDKYSEVFIDRAYDWGYGDLYGICGLNFDVEDILPNTPFTVNAAQAQTIDKLYTCAIALAIVDKDGHIKDFLKTCDPVADNICPSECIWTYTNYDFFKFGGASSTDLGEVRVYTDCTDIETTDHIQLMSRRLADPNEDGMFEGFSYVEDNWKIIAGTLEAPSYLPIKGNIPKGMSLNWQNPQNLPLWSPIGNVDNINFAMANTCMHVFIGHGRGPCSVKYDGYYAKVFPNSTGSEIQIYASKNNMEISIDYTPFTEIEPIVIDLNTPGTLSSYLSRYEQDKIVDLTLRGQIDIRDLDFIRLNTPYIIRLDLGDCEMCAYGDYKASTFPSRVKDGMYVECVQSNTLEELILPKTLENIELATIRCSMLKTIILPKSMKHIDGVFYNFLYQTNGISSNKLRCVYSEAPVPFDLKEGGISITTKGRNDMDSYPTTLVVPMGAKHLYENATGWKDFDEIREVENPAVFCKYINGVEYIAIGDEAVINHSSYFDLPEHVVIEDEIHFNGLNIPVTKLEHPYSPFQGVYDKEFGNMTFLTLNPGLKSATDKIGFYTGTKAVFALNRDVVGETRFSFAGNNNYTPKVFSPYLYENISIYGYDESTYYYPGAFPKLEEITTHPAKEMWQYLINRKEHKLSIVPLIDDIDIKRVIINGQETSGVDNIYEFSNTDNLEVIIDYTLYDRQNMSTIYDSVFNAQLPDSDISGIEEISHDTDSIVEIYSVNGVRVYKGLTSNIPALEKGIYLERSFKSKDGYIVRKYVIK